MKILSRATIKFSVFLSLFLFSAQTIFSQETSCVQLNSREEIMTCLYKKYLDNYQSNDAEKLKIALEAAKEYVEITEKKFICSDVVDYFKSAILELEKQIKLKSAVSNQENKCVESDRISLGYILSKFLFTSRITKPAEPINQELIEEVLKRKVNFQLNAENEKSLKQAGVSDLLLKTISQNYQPGSEVEADRLYQKYIENYQSQDIKKLRIAIEAAKEFVKKFENDGCYIEQVKYFKLAIIELDNFHDGDPVNPKVELKYKTLKELTDEFKAKNWAKVFALGKKVYELNPEFIPLFTDLASLGYEQAKLYSNKSKYNAETVFYAELAVKLMESSKKDFGIYGGLGYSYKTKAEALVRMKEILDFMKTQNLSEPENQ